MQRSGQTLQSLFIVYRYTLFSFFCVLFLWRQHWRLLETIDTDISCTNPFASRVFSDPLAVGFSAHLKNRFVSKEPSIIRFNHVLANTGNGYDVHTGIFVATVAGLYSFTIDIASAISSRAFIMSNGMYVGYCFVTGIGGKWESCTQTVALLLNIGDKVWVTGYGQVEGFEEFGCGGHKYYHSTFTGFKVQS